MDTLKTTDIDFEKGGGLVPVIVQDEKTHDILMLGYMNPEAFEKTCTEKKVIFWSRSKKRLWKKGETSGNELTVISMTLDCDKDTLLLRARPEGPTCHTGAYSCFQAHPSMDKKFLDTLFTLIQQRNKERPQGSYTTSLFEEGIDRIAQKVGEEATETIIAAKNESKQRVVEETSDLLYHLFVLLAAKEITLQEITEELTQRHK